MKTSFSVLFLGLSFIAAVIGFGLISGTGATIFRILFVASFIVGTVGLIRPRKVQKPTHASFASSFQSDLKTP